MQYTVQGKENLQLLCWALLSFFVLVADYLTLSSAMVSVPTAPRSTMANGIKMV